MLYRLNSATLFRTFFSGSHSTFRRHGSGYVYTVPLGRHLFSIFYPNLIDYNDVNSCVFVWVG